MQIIKEKARLNNWVATIKHQGGIIGLAPTMGALHEGHLSLIRQAASVCDWVVVSIFINPTQFDKPLDLQNYPQTLDKDIALLQELDLNIVVFSPIASELYGDKIETDHFEFDGVELEMEGKYRFGHFDGVGTVENKQLDTPYRAFIAVYAGEVRLIDNIALNY